MRIAAEEEIVGQAHICTSTEPLERTVRNSKVVVVDELFPLKIQLRHLVLARRVAAYLLQPLHLKDSNSRGCWVCWKTNTHPQIARIAGTKVYTVWSMRQEEPEPATVPRHP
jgi:hypothetical protein